jgi:hypothetical protein
MRDLDHLILAGAKNTNNWHARKGDLQCVFPLDVPMVTSPKLSFIANDNNPTGIGLTPSETICFTSLEFTVDRFGHMSLSLDERDSSAIFVGMVHSGSPYLHTALTNSFDKGGTGSGIGGSSGSPGPGECNVVTLTIRITTTPAPRMLRHSKPSR